MNAELSPPNEEMSKRRVLLLVRDSHLEQALSAALAQEGGVRSLGSLDDHAIEAAARAPDWDVCVADMDFAETVIPSAGERGLVLLTTSETSIGPRESNQPEGGPTLLRLPCSLARLRETVRKVGSPTKDRSICAG